MTEHDETAGPGFPVKREVGKSPEEVLHVALCQAVQIANSSVELICCEAGVEVRRILRQALIDYADAYMNQPTNEAEQAAMRRGHQLPNTALTGRAPETHE